MNKLTARFVCVLTTAIFISSCSSVSYYLPAVTGNDISYLPKPMSSDSVKTQNYISAGAAGLTLPYNSGNLDMGMLNISRAHTFKSLNVAYGAFGFAGITSYYGTRNANDPYTNPAIQDFSGKGFIGGGLRSSIGFFDTSGSADFRIISWENALSFEGGGYSNFRNRMYNLQDQYIVSSTKTTLFTTGGATEIIFHSKKNLATQIGLKLFYGVTTGLQSSLASTYYSSNKGGMIDFSLFFKVKKLYGVVELGGNRGFTSKFNLGYAF